VLRTTPACAGEARSATPTQGNLNDQKEVESGQNVVQKWSNTVKKGHIGLNLTFGKPPNKPAN